MYLQDIKRHIPYETEDTEYEINIEDVKKSFAFQNMVIVGAFKPKEYGSTRIENNLRRLAEEFVKKKDSQPPKTEEQRMESGSAPEVIVKGHMYDASGYGKVNRNLVHGLASLGTKVEISTLNETRNDLNELEIRALQPYKRKLGKNAIRIDSIIPTFSEMSHQGYRVLYTTIEAASVPDQIVNVCNAYNEVWVTSDFCKEVLVKHGVKKPVYVFAPGVQVELYNEKATPHVFRPSLRPFVFCSVFGWSYRKGYDALLKAYLKEFTGDDPVSLLIVSRYQYATERSGIIKDEIDKFIKQYGGKNPAHIARCRRVIPEYEMPRLYRACNAFVLPTRGEGFGLPYCEASLCGLPVIATNHSAQTMFLNEENSVLVGIDCLEKVQRGWMHVHYWDNQIFPSLKSDAFINNLSGAMRDVFQFYDEAKDRNKLLQKEMLKNYTIQASCARIKSRIDEIWAGIKKKEQQ